MTGPGGPFEFVVDDVLGERMQVVSGRARSLRELLERSALHDDKEYIVHGERRIAYAEHLRLVASVARGLSERYGDTKMALAAYNWGPGHIDRRLRRGTPMPKVYPGLVLEALSRQSIRRS